MTMIALAHMEHQLLTERVALIAMVMVTQTLMRHGRSTMVQMPSLQKAHNGPIKILTDMETMRLVSKLMHA